MRINVKAASRGILGCTVLFSIAACNSVKEKSAFNSVANKDVWPKVESAVKQKPAIEARIAEILGGMTLEQKVAQTIQPEIRSFTVEEMREYGFGSYLNGGGAFPNNNKNSSSSDWVALAEAFYAASVDDSLDGSAIPTMWGTDAVHGHNNVIGATIFPHNIGLGAANNPELIRKIGAATALEVMATGIDWVFAPTVAVARDDRWGRTYEAYSEAPEIVEAYSVAMVEGMQGKAGEEFLTDSRVIATAKHFLGDGGTHEGDDQGNALASEAELRDIHGRGYVGSIQAGVQTVMASFNSWHGEKMHGNKSLITGVLKEQMGFDGLVVGDWNGHGQVAGCTNESCAQAFNAGVDIFMVPNDWKKLYENTIEQVKSGEISMARLDDAVTRILRVKLRAGLFDASPAKRSLSGKSELIGAAAHRDIARQAVRESLVLLKNKGGLLPLSREAKVLVAGDGADNIGKISGGWSITWQGTGNTNSEFPGATSIYQGIKDVVSSAGGSAALSVDGSYTQKPDVAVVVFGENPYAEGEGDLFHIEYSRNAKADLALLEKFKAAGIPVVSIFITGRPLWVNSEINASDAFVAAWLPGTEGQGISDVIFKAENGEVNYDFKGKLSFSWPKRDDQVVLNRGDKNYDPLFAYGYGLTYSETDTLGELSEVRSIKSATQLAGATSDQAVTAAGHIFKSRALKGTSLVLGDASNWSVPANASIVSSEAGVVNMRATNWKIQEDSRELNWSGAATGVVYFQSEATMNWLPLADNGSVISLDLKVHKRPTADTFAIIGCGLPCKGAVALNKTLNAIPEGEWKNISIDLACFSKAGADLGQVQQALSLETAGELGITFSNIQLEPNKAKDATISCSE